MQKLNLPYQNVSVRTTNNKTYLFDIVRRKWVLATPEEWVRQNIVQYLVNELGYPAGLISVEYSFKFATGKIFRADIVVFDKNIKPIVVVECKSPSVTISKETLNQISLYNIHLKSNFLILSNGISHYVVENKEDGEYQYLKSFPKFGEIIR